MFSFELPTLNSQHDLQSLLQIGSSLYTMMSSIYNQQFQDSQALIPNADFQLSAGDLLLEEEISFSQVSKLNSASEDHKSLNQLRKNSSFSTRSFIENGKSFWTNSYENIFEEQVKNDEFDSVFMDLDDEIAAPAVEFQEKKSIVKEKNKFFCRFCGYVSNNKQQLGGHMSRKHPGKGANFQKRKIAERNKEYERVLKDSASYESLFLDV